MFVNINPVRESWPPDSERIYSITRLISILNVAYNRLERKAKAKKSPGVNWKQMKYHLKPFDEYNIYTILKHLLAKWDVVKSGGYSPKMSLSVVYSSESCNLSALFFIDEIPDHLIRQIMYAGRSFKDIFITLNVPYGASDSANILQIDGQPIYLFLNNQATDFDVALKEYYDKSPLLQTLIKRPPYRPSGYADKYRIYLHSAKTKVCIKNLHTGDETFLPVEKSANNYYYSDF